MNYQNSTKVTIVGNKVTINGYTLPPAPCEGKNSTIVNDKVYLDGYEWKNGYWKKTLRGLWHKWF